MKGVGIIHSECIFYGCKIIGFEPGSTPMIIPLFFVFVFYGKFRDNKQTAFLKSMTF